MNKKMLIISTIVLLFDQIFKAITELSYVHVNIINNFLSFNYYQNTGAAWSILEGKVNLLIIISIIVLLLVYNLTFSYKESRLVNISFGILFGGILGNLIDRIFLGYVRDFIDINIFNYNFPVFNIADMGIVIGVILLVIITIKGEVKNEDSSKRIRRKAKN